MKTITGTFVRPDGSPAANAILELLLSQDAVTTSPMAVLVHGRIPIQLDANGSIPAGTQIAAVDEILPVGCYYRVVVLDPVYGKCYDERLFIQGASPISISSLVPALQPS
jgi:hypothetical protein